MLYGQKAKKVLCKIIMPLYERANNWRKGKNSPIKKLVFNTNEFLKASFKAIKQVFVIFFW